MVELTKVEKINNPLSDPEVQQALNAQLNFKNKIENNASIIKDIKMGAFNKEKFEKFLWKTVNSLDNRSC